jgi:hypothetical protein
MFSCNCDYDPCDVWDETKRKARKAHKCTECRGAIKPGETYTVINMLFDGSWSTAKRCEDCSVVVCDLGKLTKAHGGCFCYGIGQLPQDMCDLAGSTDEKGLKLLEPVFHAFNAASRTRGGMQLSLRWFDGTRDMRLKWRREEIISPEASPEEKQ